MKTFTIWLDHDKLIQIQAEKAQDLPDQPVNMAGASWGSGAVRFSVGDNVIASFRLMAILGWSEAQG